MYFFFFKNEHSPKTTVFIKFVVSLTIVNDNPSLTIINDDPRLMIVKDKLLLMINNIISNTYLFFKNDSF